MSNREIIEWLKKKAEAVPMPGARKMYEAAAKALEAAQPELGTNLAEVGTDAISRQQAINALDECYCGGEDSCGEPWVYKENAVEAIQMIEPIPSAQPEIIRCKDCKYAEYIDDVQTLWCTECGQGRTVAPYDFCSYGERREDG